MRQLLFQKKRFLTLFPKKILSEGMVPGAPDSRQEKRWEQVDGQVAHAGLCVSSADAEPASAIGIDPKKIKAKG